MKCVNINLTSLLVIANSITDFLDEVYPDIIYFQSSKCRIYCMSGTHTRVGKSSFTVVHMERHAGYDYYNSFINSKECHNATVHLGTIS
jgi:exonuclease III